MHACIGLGKRSGGETGSGLRGQLFTPKLEFDSLEDLNDWLLLRCNTLGARPHPEQKDQSVDALFALEQGQLRPLGRGFDGYVEKAVRVQSTCLVQYDCNRYSVPAQYAGSPVCVRAYASRIVVVSQNEVIAEHKRYFTKNISYFEPWHYVPLLERKPSALRDGAPFVAWDLPVSMAKIRARYREVKGGDRDFVALLMLVQEHDIEVVDMACELALEQKTTRLAVIINGVNWHAKLTHLVGYWRLKLTHLFCGNIRILSAENEQVILMESAAKIRRLVLRDGEGIRSVSRSTGIARNTIKKYLKDDQPPTYQRKKPPVRGKLSDFEDRLSDLYKQDLERPRKERRTATKLYEHLVSEGYKGSYDPVCRFIRTLKKEGSSLTGAFVPLHFKIGDALQFDWSEEHVVLGGIEQKIKVGHFRLSHSRKAFVVAYPNEQQEMVLDAFVKALAFYDGVPRRVIIDNPKTMVTYVSRSKERVFHPRFQALMNHYVIEPVACTPASGWEKGQVEKQVRDCAANFSPPSWNLIALKI